MKKTNYKNSIFIILIIVLLICCLCSVIGFGYYYFEENKNDNNETSNNTENIRQSENIEKDGINSASEKYNAESDLINLIDEIQPAVVTVNITQKIKTSLLSSNSSTQRQTVGSGTGFFISKGGLLITNEHVVCGVKPEDILIIDKDQNTYTVKSVESDSSQDISILEIDTKGKNVSFLKFANDDSELKVGQEVIAIGNPYGDNPGSVSKGIISGLNRNVNATGQCNGENTIKDYEGVLQTDAAINSGNSGGPLLNMRGEVVGVNSATLSNANNISYTVPFQSVKKILNRYLKNNNKIISPFIGITHSMVSTAASQSYEVPIGALVLDVLEDSPAEKSGLRKNDIITQIGEFDVNFSFIATLNQNFEPGDKTIIKVYRSSNEDLSDGQIIDLNITIGQR